MADALDRLQRRSPSRSTPLPPPPTDPMVLFLSQSRVSREAFLQAAYQVCKRRPDLLQEIIDTARRQSQPEASSPVPAVPDLATWLL